jgi:NADH:ubiquinone oxidoreductase subunit 5 (subunit L)/multisubunit Na+/H+ antiporter MnhA subunit
MENFPQLVPLVILIPAVGAFINLFLGARLAERGVAMIASVASGLTFIVALLLYSYLLGSGFEAAVVNPPFLDGWIRIPAAGVDFPWQLRVDTLSVTMMLFVTGVGTLIHIYAAGYMHGDPRFSRFFVYLNMFLAFMLILITGNNLLMMFVGWEGVGLCSFLLIGFWFDKTRGEGWKNSNAARKAFVVNRIGDFGLIMGMILTFWAFGTLDYFKAGELANPHLVAELAAGGGGHGAEEAVVVAGEDDHSEEGAVVADDHGEEAAADEHGAVADNIYAEREYLSNDHITELSQLGIFGQAERMLGEGNVTRDIGPWKEVPIETIIALIAFFFLVGAAGKSAQIPLFVWLPDAMAGPTPVSALIHAATMVTAGVYLMVRCNVFFHEAEFVSFLVSLIGMATALVGGFIALGQWDIKRVLAYSTVSQLGFMVAAVGVGAYGAAIFHMFTHAFFKALLFLGSGSVIHGIEHGHHHAAHGHDGHDEVFDAQDMRNMGGLAKRMPVTYWTYLIGTLALSGIFPFAGFWSKDEILADSWLAGIINNDVGGFIGLGILLAAAAFTAFYMWRQIEMVFHGEPRTEAAAHAPESSAAMTIPLVILAFFSIFAGFFNTPEFPILGSLFGTHRLTFFLEFSVVNAHSADFQWLLAIAALVIALAAIVAARRIYGHGHALTEDGRDPLQVNPDTARVWALAHSRLYWDEIYERFFVKPFQGLARFFANTLDQRFWHDWFHDSVLTRGFNGIATFLSQPIDLGLIDGFVNLLGWLARTISSRIRFVQTGYVRTYAISLLLGVILVIVFILLPLIQRVLAAGN